jgi:hypothetical protein
MCLRRALRAKGLRPWNKTLIIAEARQIETINDSLLIEPTTSNAD